MKAYPNPPAVRALSIHAAYACGRSGACCTAGWDIAVEPEVEAELRAALRRGDLRVDGRRRHELLRPTPGLPDGARSLLGLDPAGPCAFFEAGGGGLCAIHRQIGPERLPVSCRQFPRVCLLTPGSVSVTLSHYCPTAAALLVHHDRPVAIVDDPPAFPAHARYEGLDARGSLPLLRPGVWIGWEDYRVWEQHAVAVLGGEGPTPEAALAILTAQAEALGRWTPSEGPFAPWFRRLLAAPRHAPDALARTRPTPDPTGVPDPIRFWEAAVGSVPAGVPRPAWPKGREESDARWVGPAWSGLERPIRGYLAARAFGSWCALQGPGLAAGVRAVAAALTVLRVEAARACGRAERPLDADLFVDAVRAADHLLIHLASPDLLARRLGETA